MFHTTRRWCITPVKHADELVEKLTQHTWPLCTGFELLGYLFLNDSLSEAVDEEFAVVKREGETFRQVESLTVSWLDPERAFVLVDQLLAGELDGETRYGPVQPRLDTPEAHGRCALCA